MKTARVSTWTTDAGKVFLHPEAKRFIPVPCYVKTFELTGDDGQRCEVVVAPMLRPPVCLIPPNAPAWAEEAVAGLIDEQGNQRGAA